MIEIVEKEIDRRSVMESVNAPESGAIVTFDGTVRNHNLGKKVTHLYYETYPEMAVQELAKIRDEALERWPVQALSLVHRVGRIEIGESSVFIAVSAPHRKDAFEACLFAIDTLKATVPIWKKEYFEGGEVWIEGPPTPQAFRL
ncbi:MAG: molybdenum cofactor biosynthesis protein MoaE [Acidobacteriota bacterium]